MITYDKKVFENGGKCERFDKENKYKGIFFESEAILKGLYENYAMCYSYQVTMKTGSNTRDVCHILTCNEI